VPEKFQSPRGLQYQKPEPFEGYRANVAHRAIPVIEQDTERAGAAMEQIGSLENFTEPEEIGQPKVVGLRSEVERGWYE